MVDTATAVAREPSTAVTWGSWPGVMVSDSATGPPTPSIPLSPISWDANVAASVRASMRAWIWRRLVRASARFSRTLVRSSRAFWVAALAVSCWESRSVSLCSSWRARARASVSAFSSAEVSICWSCSVASSFLASSSARVATVASDSRLARSRRWVRMSSRCWASSALAVASSCSACWHFSSASWSFCSRCSRSSHAVSRSRR